MKKTFVILLFALVVQVGFAQEQKESQESSTVVPANTNDQNKDANGENDAVYNTAGLDVKPEFPGGLAAFYNFISGHIQLPDTKGQTGKVFVTFIIEKDGELTNIKVLRDIGFGTGDAVKKVLRQSRYWIPGEKDGKKVRVLYSLPVQINNK